MSAQVLRGVRVIELGGFISGPYAAQLLAELGATVIKIEPPNGGDPFRSFDGSNYSPQFCAYNKHKQSVTLDLSRAEGKSVLLRLLAEVDVVLDNFRPGVLARLGLSDATLEAANPGLIRASLTGFGASGPYARHPAYDTVAMAMSGLLSQLLDPDRPRITGPAIADAISGMYTAIGILGALVERARTRRGRRVEVAMVEAVAAFATEPFSGYFAKGVPPRPYDRAAVSQSYALRCSDGRLIGLHLSSPQKFWEGLLAAVDRPDLANDPKFASRSARMEHYEELSDALATTFSSRPRRFWQERLREHDVPHAPNYDLNEVEEDPQVQHLGTFQTLQHSLHGDVRGVASPILFDGGRASGGTAPPSLGEHTADVLGAIGLSEEGLQELRDLKVI